MYELIARWESKSGKYWADLYRDSDGYCFYRGEGCGGNMGKMEQSSAIESLQLRVNGGYFLPDSHKTPMRRVV
jgi:hypothetical protein